MSAIVPKHGQPRQLDRRAEPDVRLTNEEVQEPPRLVKLLEQVLSDIARMKRRWWPRRVDHEDREVDATGTTLHRFPHGFKGRVRWWVVDWSGAGSEPQLVRHADSDDSTLVLVSYTAGTLTLRIEAAG